ncbi:MAG TPA: 50S ribosomal protein L4, partial [bacterium]|nr:50S ribosomal protein L4 [bacterium]
MPKTTKKSVDKENIDQNLEVPVLNNSAKVSDKIDITPFFLTEEISDGFNQNFVHQILISYLDNQRQSTAKTKTRSEVSGSGKKPWKQKGTGRARHGSRRSPIWRGGGVSFGPTGEQNFSKNISTKMQKKAVRYALLEMVKNNRVIIIDQFNPQINKTKQAREFIEQFTPVTNLLVAVGKESLPMQVFLGNLNTLTVKLDYQISALDLFKANSLLCTLDSFR